MKFQFIYLEILNIYSLKIKCFPSVIFSGVTLSSAATIKTSELEKFPITFRLCANNLYFNRSFYHELGYEDDEKMFLGQSLYNSSIFGWQGHKQDGGHFSTEGLTTY